MNANDPITPTIAPKTPTNTLEKVLDELEQEYREKHNGPLGGVGVDSTPPTKVSVQSEPVVQEHGENSSPAPSPIPSKKSAPKVGEIVKKLGGTKFVVGALAMFVAVGGLASVVTLSSQSTFNLPQAFRGASVNAQRIQEKIDDAPTTSEGLLNITNGEDVRKTYQDLVAKYANQGDTEMQPIDEPSVRVKGVAYLKYEPRVMGTFVFTRLENLPLSKTHSVNVWLSKDGTSYTSVGNLTPMSENNQIVWYNVFIVGEDLRTYNNFAISYDPGTAGIPKQPGDIVLTIDF
jgi:hypothetical protein